MIRKIDHVGIAVRDLDKQTAFYRDVLGLEFEGFEDLPERGLRVGVFNVGGVHIELLQPTVPDNNIAKFIEKSGEGIHHLAFTVDDAAGELERLTAAGVQAIDACLDIRLVFDDGRCWRALLACGSTSAPSTNDWRLFSIGAGSRWFISSGPSGSAAPASM